MREKRHIYFLLLLTHQPMKRLLTLLLFCGTPVLAQKNYLPHEVEKAAEPAGGLVTLNQFISSNLRIPFQTAVKGVNGRVYLKGVVEPDGRMSQIEVTRGLDTLCNAEAVRVLAMYRAWKPALLKGSKVRQVVFYPVTFKAAAQSSYDSTRSLFVDYYDQNFEPAPDPAVAQYRRILPVNNQGFVAGDVGYEESRNKKWRKLGEANFVRKEVKFKSRYVNPKGDSLIAYHISARDFNEASHATEATFHQDGRILSYTEYELHGKASLTKDYDLNGMVRRQQLFTDSLVTDVLWDENGQIRSHMEIPIVKAGERGEPFLLNSWGTDGTQWTKDGNGYWRSVGETPDGAPLFEQGKVVNGLKDGKWTGKLADSTLFYEEVYDGGLMSSGFSFPFGEKVSYTKATINPVFKGGINEFYKFLAMNIRYPGEAARRGASGRVMLSFVVCEDGSMCDYKVESSVGFGLDDEALRVVKMMNGKWEPGVMRGRKVRVKYNVPVNFQLQGSYAR